jgi:hypothetical protein
MLEFFGHAKLYVTFIKVKTHIFSLLYFKQTLID